MANEANLLNGVKTQFKSGEEAAAKGRKGGVASGVSKRKKKDLRQALEELLNKTYEDKKGNKKTGTEAITTKLFEQALKGNIKAFETIRSTVGQDPVQKVMLAEVNQDVIDEVERAVLESGEK